MDIISGLQNKDNNSAHQLLLQLEMQSAESDGLYRYFDDFIGLLRSKSSFVRVRGFRLACAQARWDKEDRTERNLEAMLRMLEDEKPTAVRQCLAALHIVTIYKPELTEKIECRLNSLDLSRYNDSMIPLIKKDIERLRKAML